MLRKVLLVVSLVVFFISADAQISRADSIFLMTDNTIYEFQQISQLDPYKAAFLSAILPGLGQAYNNQFWKIPLIYEGG